MYSNDKLVLHLISLMKQFQIRKVVVSPGSRHFCLVHSLEADDFFQLYSVVDERSAGFFALGLIQQSGEPVAITCSSGTACINYGSAVVEAYYQKLPLLVLSGDRLPQLLNQLEDQMYSQTDSFVNCTKYIGQLRPMSNELDEWYSNRIINEALIKLTHNGRGPVQLNIPFSSHQSDTFSTEELPLVRKINLIKLDSEESKWNEAIGKIKHKKILIVWGQSVIITQDLLDSVNHFCEQYNAVVITDMISNFNNDYVIKNGIMTLRAAVNFKKELIAPDVVISVGGNYVFNGEIKTFLSKINFLHIQIGEISKVCDPFRKLRYIFEMKENTFFKKMNNFDEVNNLEYYNSWKIIEDSFHEPNVAYSELAVITSFMRSLPNNVDLQLANSCTIRMAHMLRGNTTIRVHCNRGVNGIDGCVSTAVGFGADNSRPTFLVIGDLSFFYDMNALWIRHLPKNIRILLINNGGGAVMYAPLNEEKRKTLSKHVAAGHSTSAQGWVQSVGFEYMRASNMDEVNSCIDTLTDLNKKGPMLLEVFTDINKDVRIMQEYLASIDERTFIDKVIRKVEALKSKFIS